MKLLQNFTTVLRNINSFDRLSEAVRKIFHRVYQPIDLAGLDDELAALAINFHDWAQTLNPDILEQARAWRKNHFEHVAELSRTSNVKMGEPAHVELLYFLVRLKQPKSVVETGVAAGHSSRAILTALAENGGTSKLFSSDFPYLKENDPTSAIGFVVEESLRGNWSLLIDGDRKNLPTIVQSLSGQVDLFHYDSDKTAAGRDFALDTLAPYLQENSYIIFDDIQDNRHFLKWSVQYKQRFVFEVSGKYVGLVIV